MTIYIF
ncbi:hypothetical protein [Plasmodium yoelii yoelii]|nr:hypothetical protein [Plasmodium yoelii yoelii]